MNDDGSGCQVKEALKANQMTVSSIAPTALPAGWQPPGVRPARLLLCLPCHAASPF